MGHRQKLCWNKLARILESARKLLEVHIGFLFQPYSISRETQQSYQPGGNQGLARLALTRENPSCAYCRSMEGIHLKTCHLCLPQGVSTNLSDTGLKVMTQQDAFRVSSWNMVPRKKSDQGFHIFPLHTMHQWRKHRNMKHTRTILLLA